ncbi:sodium channel and clathrin linker 1-like isoform X2 [Xenia sp. Carnegie-2017]|uniref:sodium channel and clathrin linker 1-like isoform X2 n=1 Tax=Xenia sp. Carnegie-2017 TaxID=2897299 RepID=UPI001F035C5B|nr:sodium channel and clathrin linker 1-like isoform X2 [Xenia sp. Carnegie-2017]XP_046847420.1 sodium channel and clathrin linker 1-like isoform X2 [Xenia sp. Carnegie-2017]
MTKYGKKETVCIKCGSHSYFSHHPSKAHETTLELLFRERDELVEMLSKQNSMLEQCEHREFQAIVQAKKLAESTENANLEKAKAIISIKQLESSLENERKRLDMEREKNQREVNGIVERLDKKKKEFSDKIEILTQKCDEKDHHYEQLSREKENLLCDYEKTAVELQTAHMEMNKLRVECHEEMVKMTRKLTEITEELSRLKNDKNRKDKDNEQIKISLKMEIENLKHRLMEAHNECVETREKNVKIDEKLKRTENELHQLVLSKNSYEKTQEENREFYEKQDEQREKIFLDSLQETEQKHIVLRKKLEKMLEAQMKMTSDLKEENKRLLIKLEDKTKSHKSEKSKWMNDMSTLKQELEKTREQYEVISNEKSVLIQKKRNISEKITFFKTENKKSRNLIYSLLQKQKLLMMERRSLSYELLQQNRLAGSSFQRHFEESIPVHYEQESDVVSNNNDIINHEEIDENNHKENDSL